VSVAGKSAGDALIRSANSDDVPRISELIRELADYERSLDEVTATEDSLRAALFAPSPAVFAHVALVGGDVVGFALWFLNFSTWLGQHGIYVEDLYVTPPMRGRGTGKALLAELAAICLRRGYGRLEWWVLDWNEPAIGFYRSIGARPMSEWTVQRLTGAPLADLAQAAWQSKLRRGCGRRASRRRRVTMRHADHRGSFD
jgi:GNAT superfamily N-acetyltransferase